MRARITRERTPSHRDSRGVQAWRELRTGASLTRLRRRDNPDHRGFTGDHHLRRDPSATRRRLRYVRPTLTSFLSESIASRGYQITVHYRAATSIDGRIG